MSLSFIHARLAQSVILFAFAMGAWAAFNFFRGKGIDSNYRGALVIGEILFLAQGILGIVMLILGFLLFRHDPYSAMARILFDDYLALKKENPGSNEFDLFYSIVKSRRPRWNEDRIMEFCAGKDIRQLVLLLLIT